MCEYLGSSKHNNNHIISILTLNTNAWSDKRSNFANEVIFEFRYLANGYIDDLIVNIFNNSTIV